MGLSLNNLNPGGEWVNPENLPNPTKYLHARCATENVLVDTTFATPVPEELWCGGCQAMRPASEFRRLTMIGQDYGPVSE